MNPHERDDITHALNQLQQFYGKELNEVQVKLWIRAIGHLPYADLRVALADYPKVGKHAPKPVEIIEIVNQLRDARRRENAELPAPAGPPCDPKVAAAWRYVIGLWEFDLFRNRPGITDERIDEYTAICNRQALASGNADAIPPDAWRTDIWGVSRDEAIRRQAA